MRREPGRDRAGRKISNGTPDGRKAVRPGGCRAAEARRGRPEKNEGHLRYGHARGVVEREVRHALKRRHYRREFWAPPPPELRTPLAPRRGGFSRCGRPPRYRRASCESRAAQEALLFPDHSDMTPRR